MITQLNNYLKNAKLTLDTIKRRGGSAETQVKQIEESLLALKNCRDSALKENPPFTIGVVGQMKTGKSTLLNALMFGGRNILPTAATPMTAGLTIIEYAESEDDQRFEVEFYSQEDWSTITSLSKRVEELRDKLIEEAPELAKPGKEDELERKIYGYVKNSKEKDNREETDKDEIIKIAEEDYTCYLLKREAIDREVDDKIGSPTSIHYFKKIEELSGILSDYVAKDGRFVSVVKALHIYLYDKDLCHDNEVTGAKESLRIVDTPGINDPIQSRQARTEAFLKEAHVVFMVTYSGSFLDEIDIQFMDKIKNDKISNILLVANKLDALFETDRRCPNNLCDALQYATSKLNGRLRSTKNESIKFCCTTGIAGCIYCKLSDKQELTKEEGEALEELRKNFPTDFSNDEATENSLLEICGFAEIDKYIETCLEYKNDIIDQKVAANIKNHISGVNQAFKGVIKSVKDELQIVETGNIDELKKQIANVQKLENTIIQQMQDCIMGFSQSLKEEHVTPLFERDLLKFKPRLIDKFYKEGTREYTRESTSFLKLTKNGSVIVDIITPTDVKKSEESQIDVLRNNLIEKWEAIYKKEVDPFKERAIEILRQRLYGKIDVDLCADIISRCIGNDLSGKQFLHLDNKCANLKGGMSEYIYKTDHVSFTTVFGQMSEDDADRKIKAEAEWKKNEFRKAMETRNQTVYNELRAETNTHCENIAVILTTLSNNLENNLENAFNETLTNLEKNFSNLESAKSELTERLEVFNRLLEDFNQMIYERGN